jgi:hypothetical protein
MTITTFSALFDRFERVEIPVIQRDYVQGRNEQSMVRDGFLQVLHDALCSADGNHQIDLDFVYGSLSGAGIETFQPLDGQQRLTTLFLLHWYLAWRDHAEEDFRTRFTIKGKSRFGYEVRPSSRDFINALATHFPNVTATDCQRLSDVIKDEPWFFRGWRLDPTIQAALDMIDSLHRLFANTSGLYSRLVDKTKPAITFQLLELDKFGLSDDLYIKMNARGKPLTPFETLKARFEEDLKHLFDGTSQPALCGSMPVADFFAHQIDNVWSEFFWPFRDNRTATFDDAIMNLLRVVIIATRSPDYAMADKDLTDLRHAAQASSYDWFHQRDWLDQNMVISLMTLLEHWCKKGQQPFRLSIEDKRHLDEEALFRGIISKPSDLTYLQYLQFSAYEQYLVHVEGSVVPDGFAAWMRVITNLAENTEYAGSDDLRRSFTGLHRMAPYMNDILEYLSGIRGGDVPGFNGTQLKEERIKAHLIRIGQGWPEKIALAERHDYFRGQIGFLLRFCGINLDDVDGEIARIDASTTQEFLDRFDHYFTCAAQMVDDLLKDPTGAGRVWERALLTVGDFLRRVGSNYSLLVTSRDEAGSWKRLLFDAAEGKEHALVLQELWNQLREPRSFAKELARIIKSHGNIDHWRAAIVATPGVYEYGTKKMLRFVGFDNDQFGDVYLLKKTQMKGRHAELFTFCLHDAIRSDPRSLSFFDFKYAETTSTDDKPGIYLCPVDDEVEVKFWISFNGRDDQYKLWLDCAEKAVDQDLQEVLEAEGFEEVDGEGMGWLKAVDRDGVRDAIYTLGAAIHTLESPRTTSKQLAPLRH